jgi:hypothetical protein
LLTFTLNQLTRKTMGVTLNVGYCQKIGLPNYGSEGAHCDVQIEIDASVFNDPQAFEHRMREVYATCRQAVQMELEHRQQDRGQSNTHDNRNNTENNSRNQEPDVKRTSNSPPSAKQSKYAEQLAAQVKGFGVRKLDNLCTRMYQKPFASLSGLETSNLIDTLREAKAGRLDLAAI